MSRWGNTINTEHHNRPVYLSSPPFFSRASCLSQAYFVSLNALTVDGLIGGLMSYVLFWTSVAQSIAVRGARVPCVVASRFLQPFLRVLFFDRLLYDIVYVY
jgi:hypothetical protein